YELRGETLVCRSSLRLPRYCLVTGKACPDSVALNFPLYYQPGFRVSRLGSRLIVIFLAVVWIVGCIVLGGILTGLGAPVAGIIAFAIVGIGIPLAVGLVAVHRSSSATKLPVTAFLSPGKHRARQWISWLPLVLIVPMMALDWMGVLPTRGIGGFWFLPFLVVNIISQRLWLRGLRLKLKPREDGLYEVIGFSPAFLERLREQAAVRQA
ncbi:hypothetical protein E3A20_04370, partial [Planctomyces bekefii]